MKFGEFLFLYLVARNSGDTMTNEVLEGLKSESCQSASQIEDTKSPTGKTKIAKQNKTPLEE